MSNKDVEVKPQEVILLIQRVLVLFGSASHLITGKKKGCLVKDQLLNGGFTVR